MYECEAATGTGDTTEEEAVVGAVGKWKSRRLGFPTALGDSQHVRIPVAARTYQSDVETVHRLIEDEFFDLETFPSRGDFLAKAHTYQLYFNLVRTNSHKENQSPWQIIERLAPRSPLELCLLPLVLLDYYLNDSGGYDLPRPPYRLCSSARLPAHQFFPFSFPAPQEFARRSAVEG